MNDYDVMDLGDDYVNPPVNPPRTTRGRRAGLDTSGLDTAGLDIRATDPDFSDLDSGDWCTSTRAVAARLADLHAKNAANVAHDPGRGRHWQELVNQFNDVMVSIDRNRDRVHELEAQRENANDRWGDLADDQAHHRKLCRLGIGWGTGVGVVGILSCFVMGHVVGPMLVIGILGIGLAVGAGVLRDIGRSQKDRAVTSALRHYQDLDRQLTVLRYMILGGVIDPGNGPYEAPAAAPVSRPGTEVDLLRRPDAR